MTSRIPRSGPRRPFPLAAPVAAALVLAASVVTAAFGCGLSTGGLPAETGGGGSAATCEGAAQCDDKNPCTTDTCSPDGLCEFNAIDGTAPDGEQIVGDCKTVECSAGKSQTVNDDGDTEDDGEDCTVDACLAGVATHDEAPNGTACTDTLGHTGNCAAGKCLVSCSDMMPCPDFGPCATVACDAGTGTCITTPLPDGIPTPGVVQTAGDCHVHICKSGVDFDKVDDSDVPVTPTDCDSEACNNGVPSNPSKDDDNPCSTSPVGAGFCEAGVCNECNVVKHCPVTNNPCLNAACDNHACGTSPVPNDTPLGSQVSGDCHELQCDGAGNVKNVVKDTDVPFDGKECTADKCMAGVPSNPPAPQGTMCGGSFFCNVLGECGCLSNADCTLPNTCGGGGVFGLCGCTPKTCLQLGQTCGSVSDTCFNPTLDCDNMIKDLQETDVDCGGNAGTCATRCGQGKHCNAASDCAGGLPCVDGVCCATACTGPCLACSAAKKGQGADGICGAVALGADPDNDCAPEAASTCGNDGTCDGTGACAKYAAGSVCVMQSCTNGTQTNASTCNGMSACVSGGTTNCSPYVCGATGCKLTCANDNDCVSGNYCSATSCFAKKAKGSACAMSNECTSGFCVDGFCCDTACTATCTACSAAKKVTGNNGDCGNIAVGWDPDNECSGNTACAGNGTCSSKDANGVACNGGGNCASGNCIDGVCCNSSCNGTCKACTAAIKGFGVNGLCEGIAAGTDPQNECSGGTPNCNGSNGCQ